MAGKVVSALTATGVRHPRFYLCLLWEYLASGFQMAQFSGEMYHYMAWGGGVDWLEVGLAGLYTSLQR